MKRLYVVGAGFFGAVAAERTAAVLGIPVTVIDRRDHIGGNCASAIDPETGVEYHRYGSHIFHTSDEKVWEYINRFGSFNDYRHHVYTVFNGEVFSMPINLGTINSFFRRNMTPEEAEAFIAAEAAREQITVPQNLEEKAVSLIGRPLYEAFVRGYTIKQWEKDPRELSADIISRLPVRYTYNNRYFSDRFEGIPLEGYSRLIGRIFDHPGITVRLNTQYRDIVPEIGADDLVLYTGAIDEFSGYCFGKLEWRTADFETERFDHSDYQGTAVMNYAGTEVPYTRIHEFKHYHPERPDTGRTIIFKEYPRSAGADDEPFYPVLTEKNLALYRRYREAAAEKAPGIIFGGRLGLYRYLDMDDTIAAALECFEQDITPRLKG